MMTALKAGIIGLGVGESHIRGYEEHPDCSLLALCDIDESKREYLAYRYPEARLYPCAEQLIDDPDVNVVSIASFDEDHFNQICGALTSGKHVFVEKPLCQSQQEMSSIRRLLVDQPSLKLSSNLKLRTCPRFVEVREMIANQAFGQIYYLEADYNYGRLSKLTDGWRGKQKFYSVVYGGGIHVVDLLMWLTNDRVNKVSAFGNDISTSGSEFRHKDMVVSTLSFESGMVGKVAINFGCVSPHFHKLSVYGTNATFENRTHAGLIYKDRDKNIEPIIITSPYPGTEKHSLIPSFLDSIMGIGLAVVDERVVFDSMSVCLAIEQAVNDSKIVTVEYGD